MEARIIGAILAGGQGTRLGALHKGLLERAPGETLIEHLMGQMEAAGLAEVVIAANMPEPYRRFGRAVVPDLRPGLGPLAGVEAVLLHVLPRPDVAAVLFVACDLPALSARELARLVDAFRRAPHGVQRAVVTAGPSREYPICFVVHKEMAGHVTSALDRRHLKILQLWKDLHAKDVTFPDAEPFHNLNTPDDLRRWQGQVT